ncbi:response regulator [Brevundimonas sp. 2R-24]|uniref:histidine kinase n=1 Tax=Peiella sedimenti TaxID=3061083 RepID=A0ABT8SLZ0_9CAUL|nr:response regulator [Caulobacteraceae bacterium XZ-24]
MSDAAPSLAQALLNKPDSRATARLAMEAQIQLLPYALGFFGICLPVFVAVAAYAPNALWVSVCLGVYGFNWAVFYAILDWRKRRTDDPPSGRLAVAVHVAASLLWALSVLQTAYFAVGAGPLAEVLLVLSAGAAVGVIFFSSPLLPALLTAGPVAAAGPVIFLAQRPETSGTATLILSGLSLALALAMILNRHLREHFAMAMEREDLISDREAALAESRRLAKSKSDIVATLSHEIRNGLSGVAHVLAGALGAGSRGAPSRDQLKAALHASRDLVEVLDATLDSEIAETGSLTLTPRPIEVRRLAEDLALLQRPQAVARGLELSAQVDDAIPPLKGAAIGDGARVRQILNNLIGNAIKYTVRGRVELRVRLIEGDFIRFEVADTGPGLSEDELAKAFEPFRRIERTGAGVPGAGLGLSLSWRLAQLMGGRLGADSAPGVGSRFWLDLPWDAEAEAPPRSDTAPAQTRALRILVAEDDSLNAAMLRAVLEQLGHRVLHAQDGRRALDLLNLGEIDLVMLDGRMPGMDGLTALKILRKLETSAAELPVIAVTGGDAEEAAEMLAAGADAVLRKPVSVTAVARAVADAAERGRRAPAPKTEAA